jgi:D-tyrosyl-tRNA(Tyr) deacylase
MRAVVQRVTHAKVSVDNKIIGKIGKGLVVLLGIGTDETEKDITYLADKIMNLRVFEDENGKMNISLKDIGGELLIISQFTLYGDCRRGNRPSYSKAAPPEEAERIYNKFIEYCKQQDIRVETGKFQAEMLVEIHNDGPVTIMIDSNKEF